MQSSCCTALLVAVVVVAAPAAAQTDHAAPTPPEPTVSPLAAPADAAPIDPGPAIAPALPAGGGSFLRDLGGDFSRFFSRRETLWTVGALGTSALLASNWDTSSLMSAQEHLSDEAFGPGRLAGNFYVNLSAGGGAYLIGRAGGHGRLAEFGSSLMRAQILSQAVVQAGKIATQRGRPDASNNHSLPSGHTATAFATAGVVHRYFGWKAAIPAHAFAAYIGASRLQANRHYLSDVLLGAGIGLAAAHAVTVDIGPRRFSVAAAPTPGGVAVTFTSPSP